MLEPNKVLDYFADVSLLGTGPVISLGSHEPVWEIGYDAVSSGVLDIDLTRDILHTYCDAHSDVPYGMRRVSVVCCLRSLVSTDGEITEPLLLLPGLLDADGHLTHTRWGRAWIPNDKVVMRAFHDHSLAICDLDALRTHQAAMTSLPHDGSWRTEVQRAVDLFESVCTLDEDELLGQGLSIQRDTCLMVTYEHPLTSWTAAGVIEAERCQLKNNGWEALSAPLLTMLGQVPDDSEDQDVLADDGLMDLKLLCGVPGHLPELGPHERQAVVSFARHDNLPVAVLESPKGTNHLSVVLSIMANTLTEAALRGDRAPVMFCAGRWDELQHMLQVVARRPKTSQSAIPTRWIPRIGGTDPQRAQGRRILGPVPTPFLLHTCEGDPTPQDRWALPQKPGHGAASAGAWYSDLWYAPKAATYFLDCVSSYFQQRVHDTRDAVMLLSERLRKIDQDRCELIDAYHDLYQASEQMRERDALVSELSVLRGSHSVMRERLVYWSNVASKNPPRRSLMGRSPANQASVVAMHMAADEEIARGKDSVSDVCAAYHEQITTVEQQIEKLRKASLDLSRRIRASAPIGERCAQIISRLIANCRLSPRESSMLESVNDGRDVNLDRLDAILDATVRPYEFWLAVHVFEGRWLDASLKSEAFKRAAGEDGIEGLRVRAHLCPLSLVTVDSAIAALVKDYSDVEKVEDERIDLLVVLGADRVAAARGAALLGRADRCLVVGTEATMGPIPLLGAASDELRATQIAGEGSWRDLLERSLVSSAADASLFSALKKSDGVRTWRLEETFSTYGELDDFRTQLFSEEPLRTLRDPSSCSEDPDYALRALVPSLSYVLVPDSSWERLCGSRRNRAEAMATMRWLNNHADELVRRLGSREQGIALLTPFHAQAGLLGELLESLPESLRSTVCVSTLDEVGNRTWPLVVFEATCGPDAYREDGPEWPARILAEATAAAQDALVVFLGSAWTRSTDETATALMKRSLRVGRLFSMARSRATDGNANPVPAAPQALDLRAKPLSLTALIRQLVEQGELSDTLATADANKALSQAGLIERVTTDLGAKGWRPTAAGREVGILQKLDRNGNPFCSYTKSSEAVVTTVLRMLGNPQ